jgi:NAD+ kinase
MKYAFMSRDDQQSRLIKTKLETKLNLAGHVFNSERPDILIFVGGDGTFLRSIQTYLHLLESIIFVGIHTGTLGFFCEFHDNQINDLIKAIPTFKRNSAEYALVELTLSGKNKHIFYAVNEVRVENPFHTFVTDVYIDKQALQTFRGTGLIVASTLGSSAYNKSLGGALVDVTNSTLQLTEMATIQNNAYRSLGSSLVLDAKRIISFKGDFKKAIFGYDYLLADVNESINEVTVRLSNKSFKLYHQKQTPFFDTLKKTFVKNVS